MAVPDFQSFFKPLLDVAADGKEHSMKEAREIIAERMSIAEEDLRELLPSGTQTKFDNRIAWAKSYFVQANVLESPRRGWFRTIPPERHPAKPVAPQRPAACGSDAGRPVCSHRRRPVAAGQCP